MLRIEIINDGTGSDNMSNYDYKVYINQDVISEGRIENHIRHLGWQELVKQLGRQLGYKSHP